MPKNDNPEKQPYNRVTRNGRSYQRKTTRGSTNDNLSGVSHLYALKGTIFPLVCPEPTCRLELFHPDVCWMHFVLKHLYEENRIYPDSFYEPFREKHRKQKVYAYKVAREIARRARRLEDGG